MNRRLAVWLTGLAALLFIPSLQASPNVYLGASAGQSQIEEDFGSGVDLDEEQAGYKVFAGARFGLMGIEGGYVDFGNPEVDVGGTNVDLGLTGWDLFGTVNLPLGPAGVFAKAGLVNWNSEVDVAGISADDDGTDPAWGLGARFSMSDSVALRAEYEVFDVDGVDNLTMWSAGVEIGF